MQSLYQNYNFIVYNRLSVF